MTQTTHVPTITQDSFVFSVYQAFQARAKADGEFNSHLRYEPFLEHTWQDPQSPPIPYLKKCLFEIAEHHFKAIPQYKNGEDVDLENISWFSHSIAVLFADFNRLLLSFVGSGLPTLEAARIPRSSSNKYIQLALNKHSDFVKNDPNETFKLFPLMDKNEAGEDINMSQAYAEEIWSLISYIVKKVFASYWDLFLAYAEWKYCVVPTPPVAIDWNVRPPCGAAYRSQFKELFEERRSQFKNKRSDKPRHAQSEQKNSGQKLEQNTNETSSHVNGHIEQNHDHKHRDHKKKDFSRGSDRPKKHSDKPRKTDEEFQLEQDKKCEEALEECKNALQTLNKNPNVPEIPLSAQNSFIRKKQHTVITDAGFVSESRGEDQNRHVCIVRPPL